MDGQSLWHWLRRKKLTCLVKQRCQGARSSCLLHRRWEEKWRRLQMQEEETILPSFSPLTPSLASSSQLGAPCLLQHYNSLGGHFRPIKPASRDSSFSLCLLLLLVPHNHSVISTLDTKALSLTNQFGRFNDWGRQGRNRKKASCCLRCLILVRSSSPRPR